MHNQRINIPGTYNLRDVGGYTNRNGLLINTGRFYRADLLGRLDAAGRTALKGLGVATIIDLRTAKECQDSPNPFCDDRAVRYHWLDMVGNSEEIVSRGDTIETANREARLPNGYFADPVGRIAAIYITILDHQQAVVRQIFAALAAQSEGAALFHCVAGQDRTGLTAALLLTIADVDEATIIADYAGTAAHNVFRYQNEHHQQYWKMDIQTADQYGSQFCPAAAMERTLHHLEQRYGGPVAYLRASGVGEDQIAQLSHRLLQTAV